MKRASSPARKSTAGAISSRGSPRRPIGMAATAAAIASGLARSMLSAASVLAAGSTTLTVIAWRPPSRGGVPRQAADGFFGDVVADGPGVPDRAVPGREVDDPAAPPAHVRERGLHRPERSAEPGVERPVDLRIVEHLERRRYRQAGRLAPGAPRLGVVDQDVEAPVGLN